MLHQCMEVLRLFSPERTDLGVVEVAELLGKPRSSVSRWMAAMAEAGFLERDAERGRYRISMSLAALGELARRSTSLQQVARGVLEALTRTTGETSNLVVRDGDAAVNVEGVASSRPIRHVGVLGRRLPLHATAAGKALMAWLPPETVGRILSGPREAFTPATLVEPGALEAELETVRREGWAIAWGELEEDLAAAAAPVRDHRGGVVAAVVLSIPTSRVSRESLPELARQVAAGAITVSRGLGWRGPEEGVVSIDP